MKKKQIKKWQDAFKQLGLDPKVLPDVSMLAPEDRKPVVAQYILAKVAKALNGDWVADHTNRNQYKYAPWFIVKADTRRPSGFGLSFSACAFWLTCTSCGVRLCYKDSETAEYAGKTFIKLYEDLYLM